MHIPDGFLDAKTLALTGALSAGGLAVAARQVNRTLPRNKIPLMGLGAAVAVVWAAIFAALLGGVDEFHQQWIPGRSMEFFDWVADFAGGTAGGFCSAVAVSMLPVPCS